VSKKFWKNLKSLFGWTVPAITTWSSVWSPFAHSQSVADDQSARIRMAEPTPVTFPTTLNAHADNIFAAHRSHRSHRSHSSHRSHYSSRYSTSPSVTTPSPPPSSAPPSGSSPSISTPPSLSTRPSTPQPPAAIASGDRVFVKYNDMFLYAQPDLDSSTVDTISTRTQLTVINVTPEWLHVTTPSGTNGWIPQSWVAQVQQATPEQRQRPSTVPAPRPPGDTSSRSLPPAQPDAATLQSMVIRVQMALHVRQYDPGPIDGELGLKTRTALKAFQRDYRLPQTGRMDTATLDALGIALP
jgi:uncharacterized protein YgiM (DUF1202 family)